MHEHKVGDIWYRYEDHCEEDRHSIHLYKFDITRVTDKCVFIRPYGEEKRILAYARKRWANPTIDLAKDSFKKRKLWQQHYARRQLTHVNAVLIAFETMDKDNIYFYDDGARMKGLFYD